MKSGTVAVNARVTFEKEFKVLFMQVFMFGVFFGLGCSL